MSPSTKIFLKLLIVTLCFEESGSTPKQVTDLRNFSDWRDLVEHLILPHFTSGSAIIVSTEERPGSQHFTENLQNQTSSLLALLNRKNYLSIFNVLLSSNISLSSQYHVHKLSSQCKLTFTVVNNVVESYFSAFFLRLLVPTNNPIVRRQRDHFMFVTSSEEISTAILYSHLSYQLRYKIVIHRSSNDLDGILGRTLCIYCSSDKLISIKFSSARVNLPDIFPDVARNFHNYAIRVSGPTKYIPSYEMENINGTYRHKRGVFTFLFNMVANKLNMSYTLEPCSKFGKLPGGTGMLLENGTWTGTLL